MRTGIGLPATVPGVERAQLLDWARAAEERGFASLGTIDRLVYSNGAAGEEAGCHDLILFPCSTDPAQVELLASAAV